MRDLLVDWRNNGCASVKERFVRAVAEGIYLRTPIRDSWPGTSPPARPASPYRRQWVGREELQRLADAALSNWPPAVG
jgi:hypothetical protein